MVSSEGLSGAGDPLPRWFIPIALGRRLQLFSMGLYGSCLGTWELGNLLQWQLVFSRVSDWRDRQRERERERDAFFDLVSEVTHHHFCYILLELNH